MKDGMYYCTMGYEDNKGRLFTKGLVYHSKDTVIKGDNNKDEYYPMGLTYFNKIMGMQLKEIKFVDDKIESNLEIDELKCKFAEDICRLKHDLDKQYGNLLVVETKKLNDNHAALQHAYNTLITSNDGVNAERKRLLNIIEKLVK